MRLFIAFFILALTYSCNQTTQAGPDYSLLDNIPTKQEVGHLVMPDTIAPVSAPFEMPVFKKPTFPNVTINLKDKLSVNKSKLITTIVQNAIDELSASDGGTVIIPKEEWKTGRISLKSNVNLHIEEGATVRFSTDVKDYQPAVFTRVESLEVMSLGSCIYANGQENIALTGKGKLIGPFAGEIKERSYSKPIESLVDLSKPAEAKRLEPSEIYMFTIVCLKALLFAFVLKPADLEAVVVNICITTEYA